MDFEANERNESLRRFAERVEPSFLGDPKVLWDYGKANASFWRFGRSNLSSLKFTSLRSKRSPSESPCLSSSLDSDPRGPRGPGRPRAWFQTMKSSTTSAVHGTMFVARSVC